MNRDTPDQLRVSSWKPLIRLLLRAAQRGIPLVLVFLAGGAFFCYRGAAIATSLRGPVLTTTMCALGALLIMAIVQCSAGRPHLKFRGLNLQGTGALAGIWCIAFILLLGGVAVLSVVE